MTGQIPDIGGYSQPVDVLRSIHIEQPEYNQQNIDQQKHRHIEVNQFDE